ncbi:transcription factor Adf-1-like isoform X2 [Mugil cephalus]|uniref:transcription factor Adf-1-like isoform X2 n=1 Tax=Mugil cephalus TaxID=48193 RepID=UPI001FB75BC8|nr:transcription factor Adf-1-like isoform X2 [Mugil cephalus]
MDRFEAKLAEEVRKYDNLYDTSSKEHKDTQMANNTWKEVARTLCTEERVCRKRWRYLRDKFAKAKRRVQIKKNCDPDGRKTIPLLYTSLQWLDAHIKHRETIPNRTVSHTEVSERAGEPEEEEDKDEKTLCSSVLVPVVSTSVPLVEQCQTNHHDSGPSHKRKRQTTTQTEISSAEGLTNLRDEDELFLLSLLPSLKRLTIKKRMEVRMKFQQVLYAAEFEDQRALKDL